MYKKSGNLILIIIASIASSACSNVNSQWDCPKQSGMGCINIEAADRIATEKIASNVMGEERSKQALSGKDREVWFAPYRDEKGHSYEAITLMYGD